MTTPVDRPVAGGDGNPPTRIPARIRTPIWRRITAFFSLSFLTVVTGIVIAGVIGITILMMLFLLERAIAT